MSALGVEAPACDRCGCTSAVVRTRDGRCLCFEHYNERGAQ